MFPARSHFYHIFQDLETFDDMLQLACLHAQELENSDQASQVARILSRVIKLRSHPQLSMDVQLREGESLPDRLHTLIQGTLWAILRTVTDGDSSALWFMCRKFMFSHSVAKRDRTVIKSYDASELVHYCGFVFHDNHRSFRHRIMRFWSDGKCFFFSTSKAFYIGNLWFARVTSVHQAVFPAAIAEKLAKMHLWCRHRFVLDCHCNTYIMLHTMHGVLVTAPSQEYGVNMMAWFGHDVALTHRFSSFAKVKLPVNLGGIRAVPGLVILSGTVRASKTKNIVPAQFFTGNTTGHIPADDMTDVAHPGFRRTPVWIDAIIFVAQSRFMIVRSGNDCYLIGRSRLIPNIVRSLFLDPNPIPCSEHEVYRLYPLSKFVLLPNNVLIYVRVDGGSRQTVVSRQSHGFPAIARFEASKYAVTLMDKSPSTYWLFNPLNKRWYAYNNILRWTPTLPWMPLYEKPIPAEIVV
ncbi:hypothetical protein J8273_8990 [Carpediemonas membranifera]|uniref:Uncharacterized protein n=1 Tax=Carpediemonas membranifera TaxID=201153 RepID=A0A8J6APA9_9EUKA|nr:hypothetical protein J8273_8990 [Carpediemonas membranifera]|eukprot:KAG9389686.1 hypothetical protein J8273_8990 [Carpediemonas membranifera]